MATINGRKWAWTDISVAIGNPVPVEEVDMIEYSESQSTTRQYGKGNRPLGYAQGNTEGSGKVRMKRSGWLVIKDRLEASAKAVGRTNWKQHQAATISVGYAATEVEPFTYDTLPQVKFTSVSTSNSQGDTEVTVELEFEILSDIQWGQQ